MLDRLTIGVDAVLYAKQNVPLSPNNLPIEDRDQLERVRFIISSPLNT